MTEFCDTEQPEICNDNFPAFKENILRLQVFMNDSFCVKISHALEKKNE